MNLSAINILIKNLKQIPGNFYHSWIRQGAIKSDRTRSQAVFSNLFLHLHSSRIHVRTLKFVTTMGMGIASLSLFLILIVTGILLMVYYKPSVNMAYDSMKDIHYVVPTGRMIRNIHRWATNLMIITVVVHMCRVFYTSAYKKPREYNWLIGMVLFVLTFGLAFTGYLLPWDQLAFWAITIGANIAASPTELTDALGITQYWNPGAFVKLLLLGASEVGQDALLRFYLLHCIVLPLALTTLLGIHFWRIRKDGGLAKPEDEVTPAGKGEPSEGTLPSKPEDFPTKTYGVMCVVKDKTPLVNRDPDKTVPSWPYLLRAELLIFMVCMAVSVTLAMLFDAPLKELANPLIPENPAKAPWYFLGLQEMISYSAFMGGMVIPGIIIIGLTLIPYLDREKEQVGIYFSGKHGKKIALNSLIFAFIAAVMAVAIPVTFGWIRNWFPNIHQLVIILINPGTLLAAAYAWWSIHILRRENSTRMAAIALFTCFIVGFIILTYVGTYLRGPNWDFYWSQAFWPSH